MSQQRYSIIPGDFAEDARADVGHFRVLNLIGRHTDRHGWCRLKQITIGEAVGLTRETVCRKLKDLVAWGYVEKRAQDATGRAIYYRTIMDRPQPLPAIGDEADDEFAGDADNDVGEGCETSPRRVSDGSHVTGTCEPGVTSGVSAKITSGVTPAVTSGVTPAITQNDPSLTTSLLTTKEVKNPPSPRGGGIEGKRDRKAQWLAELREGGKHRNGIEAFLAPLIASDKRLSLGPDPISTLADWAGQAHDVDAPSLAAAVRRLVDQPKKVTSFDVRRELNVARTAGVLFVIQRGTPQWAAWMAFWQREEPQRHKIARNADRWQAPREWPPGHKPASKTEAA